MDDPQELQQEVDALRQRITELGYEDTAIVATDLRFRQTLDALADGCLILGADWRCLYVNEAYAHQRRLGREALTNRLLTEAFPGIESTATFTHLRLCLADRAARRIMEAFSHSDGSRGLFELSIQPVPVGLFVFSLDRNGQENAECGSSDVC